VSPSYMHVALAWLKCCLAHQCSGDEDLITGMPVTTAGDQLMLLTQ
jgi:hypothetical protein